MLAIWLMAVSLPATAVSSPPIEVSKQGIWEAVDAAAERARQRRLAALPEQERIIERARLDDWSTGELFDHLELGEPDDCGPFAEGIHLIDRKDRWRDAIALLDRIDPEAVDGWLLGTEDPPAAVIAEVDHHVRCLVDSFLDAAVEHRDVRVFPDISDHFGGQFDTTAGLARAVDRSSRWLHRAVSALVRSHHRTLQGQSWIWLRKFQFRGRAFNRISEKAHLQCSLGGSRLWRPENTRHRNCWLNVLSKADRQREILVASAAPGLSRHHWGTDIDILGLNPLHFKEGYFFHGAWQWLDTHALDHGFFQPYSNSRVLGGHFEERWHWSYYPIGQAIWEYIRDDPRRFEEVLFDEWDRLESRWGPGGGPYFDYVRDNWKRYLFGIAVPSR